jgi:hypothetical protein
MDDTPAPRAKPGRKPSGVHRQALNLRLEVDVVRQLKIHALLSESTASDIVAKLVREHLRVFSLAEAKETP